MYFRATGLAGPAASLGSNAEDMGDWLVFLLTGQGNLGNDVMDVGYVLFSIIKKRHMVKTLKKLLSGWYEVILGCVG